ncbi:MAG TPA: DUF3784 domain-containing protein [Ohtaekwangia sp.]|nr:DUF3784 domain-containing protein [Ohtaekwangia sp.]
MIYVLTGLSLLFVAIGFIVTEQNAKYLLSGYNTMHEEDRKKVNIEAYIPYLRKFHILLGVSFLVVGVMLNYLLGEIAVGVFTGVYPIVAYIFFIVTSARFSYGVNIKWNRFGVYTLVATLIVVLGLLYFGVKEDELVVGSAMVKIKGMYYEEIHSSAIKSVELADELPAIATKTNGFALGSINKGHFKTQDGEKIKLILNTDIPPYILLIKKSGEKIYFSGKSKSTEVVYHEIKTILSGNGLRYQEGKN